MAVPSPPLMIPGLTPQHYHVVRFEEAYSNETLFVNGSGPDVVHAWTPRENVRKFCRNLRERCHFHLVVHLEDNEEAIIERYFDKPFETFLRTYFFGVPEGLSHPKRYKKFLDSADGISIIVNPLREFVPESIPWILLWPGVDTSQFFPKDENQTMRKKMGIPPNVFVLAYTGNVHPANADEVKCVYEAAALLSRKGQPALVLRTGKNLCEFSGNTTLVAEAQSIELGYIDYGKIPDVLACADLLVQPGRVDRFNIYRFPSKLPEYLAMGKPIIMPRANIGEHLVHLQEALIYPNVDTLQIVEAASLLASDGELRDKLGRGARTFAENRLNWMHSSKRLKSFYEDLIYQAQ